MLNRPSERGQPSIGFPTFEHGIVSFCHAQKYKYLSLPFLMILCSGKRGLDLYSLLVLLMAVLSTVWYLGFVLLGLWNGKVLGEVVAGPDLSLGLQDILNKAHQGPLYTYPTSLTQGIVPVSRKLFSDLHGNEDC
jgi:hypothetical protein